MNAALLRDARALLECLRRDAPPPLRLVVRPWRLLALLGAVRWKDRMVRGVFRAGL